LGDGFNPGGARYNGELSDLVADPHFLPVIVELFAAVEANDIGAVPASLRDLRVVGWSAR